MPSVNRQTHSDQQTQLSGRTSQVDHMKTQDHYKASMLAANNQNLASQIYS